MAKPGVLSSVSWRVENAIAGVGGVRADSVRGFANELGGTRVFSHVDATASELAAFDHPSDSSGTGGDSGAKAPPGPSADDAPQRVMRELDRMVQTGQTALWANFDEHNRSLETWLEIEGPLAPLSPRYGINCWEMICYAAGRAGVLDKHVLRDLLTPPRSSDGSFDQATLDAWLVRTGERLIPGDRNTYTGEPGTPRPQHGDIVIWDRSTEHVAAATGRTGPDGSPEIYSFWPPPQYDLTPDPETGSRSRVIDAIQVTTVDLVSAAATRAGLGEQFEILFGRGPW